MIYTENDNILVIIDKTPCNIMMSVAGKVKARRHESNLTQLALARRADMSLASYRRFERKGEIAFKSLVKIAIAMDCADDFANLFSQKAYRSIDELVKQNKNHKK